MASVISSSCVEGPTRHRLGGVRRMTLSRWDEGSDSDQVTGLRDEGLVGNRRILTLQLARQPRYRREGTVEVRPFPAKKRLRVSEAQGLSSEAVKGNPTTTVIPRVDESKSGPRANRRLDRTLGWHIIITRTLQCLTGSSTWPPMPHSLFCWSSMLAR